MLMMQWNEESDPKWNRQDTTVNPEPKLGYRSLYYLKLDDQISLYNRRPVNLFVANDPNKAKQRALAFKGGDEKARVQVLQEIVLDSTFNKFTQMVKDSTSGDKDIAELLVWPVELVPDSSQPVSAVMNPKMPGHMLITVRMRMKTNVNGDMLVNKETEFKEKSDQDIRKFVKVVDLIPAHEQTAWKQWFDKA